MPDFYFDTFHTQIKDYSKIPQLAKWNFEFDERNFVWWARRGNIEISTQEYDGFRLCELKKLNEKFEQVNPTLRVSSDFRCTWMIKDDENSFKFNFHRLDGPALDDQIQNRKEWWVDGKCYGIVDEKDEELSLKEYLAFIKAANEFRKEWRDWIEE